MHVLVVCGWSGSGKTTLIERVLPRLVADGLRVSTIKHAHHDVDLDRPGKDSYRHRAAGATEVLLASAGRWALLHENATPDPPLEDLLARLAPVDLVLVEGFKRDSYPKLEVHRPALGRPPLWPDDPSIAAVATDADVDPGSRIRLPLGDDAAVAAWVRQFLATRPPAR